MKPACCVGIVRGRGLKLYLKLRHTIKRKKKWNRLATPLDLKENEIMATNGNLFVSTRLTRIMLYCWYSHMKLQLDNSYVYTRTSRYSRLSIQRTLKERFIHNNEGFVKSELVKLMYFYERFLRENQRGIR